MLIEYSPNYFVLDHVPRLLREQYKYAPKFIVSLRNPLSRTLSSWTFKAKEGIELKKKSSLIQADDPFNKSMAIGLMQAQCIEDCYHRFKSMKKCSITECRFKYDHRGDGRNGKYSYYAHLVKSLYVYQFLLWFAFFPKSDFFIFTIEQYRKNPIGVTEAIMNFMGLPLYDPSGKKGFTNKEVGLGF